MYMSDIVQAKPTSFIFCQDICRLIQDTISSLVAIVRDVQSTKTKTCTSLVIVDASSVSSAYLPFVLT